MKFWEDRDEGIFYLLSPPNLSLIGSLKMDIYYRTGINENIDWVIPFKSDLSVKPRKEKTAFEKQQFTEFTKI